MKSMTNKQTSTTTTKYFGIVSIPIIKLLELNRSSNDDDDDDVIDCLSIDRSIDQLIN